MGHLPGWKAEINHTTGFEKLFHVRDEPGLIRDMFYNILEKDDIKLFSVILQCSFFVNIEVDYLSLTCLDKFS